MTDVRGARIVRLLEDPAVTGDLLLVAVSLSAQYDFGWKETKFHRISPMLWQGQSVWRLKMALKDDMRTYKPPNPGARGCTAPMLRRSTECGRNASAWGYVTDWSTGEMSYSGGCSRHRDWFHQQSRANWKAKPEVPPLPCANHGGALTAHFPRLDWRKAWRRLDPTWVEHPEGKPWPKPDLMLVLGDDEGGSGSPLLSVVLSGGAS